ncbi:MAG: hypothetical protein ACYC49_07565 [Ignavibacteriaceae bacterium]
MKKYIITISLVAFFTFPVWMRVGWWIEGKKELKVVIVDKSSLTDQGIEHRSFNWVLYHDRYCKADRSLYSMSNDYYGFYPGKNKHYEIKGLESFSDEKLKELADHSDMTYFTDTYGIYKKDWYGNNYNGDISKLIYGGMSDQDLKFLLMMKSQHKLIMTEYNDIATPTSKEIRNKFEDSFGVRWTGWVGRYFQNLDTTINKGIPIWLVRDYKLQHNNKWPFKKSGIAFVNDNGRVEVLDKNRDLKDEVPYILTNERNQERFQVPEKIKYSYWFDVMLTSHSNDVISVYQIKTNTRGDSILNSMNIPNPFPAVIEHYDKDYKFYYFCGDYCDNLVDMLFTDFLGISNFSSLFYSSNEISERESFFWLYYKPLVSTILHEYYTTINKK